MINHIYKFTKYLIINNLYYYKPRYKEIKELPIKENIKDYMTNIILNQLGLKISDNDNIPWYIVLSKEQKKCIKLVKLFNYKVDLL